MKQRIVVGCNYHTTWQKHKAMRFVLKSVKGNTAILYTRTTNNEFTCKVSDLIFITTDHNIRKADMLEKEEAKKKDRWLEVEFIED
jgi:hypothetical protein